MNENPSEQITVKLSNSLEVNFDRKIPWIEHYYIKKLKAIIVKQKQVNKIRQWN